VKKIKIGFVNKVLLPLAIKIIAAVIRKVTPQLRTELEKFVLQWEEKAAATPNDIDDIAVKALKGILGM
jgi:hypothetical protein